jgi:hypothetical protein
MALAHEKIRARHAQVATTEAVGDITVKPKSSADAYAQHTGQMTKKSSTPKDPKTGKTLYQKMTSEEAEDLDEGEGIVTPKKGMSYATRSSDAYRKYAKENPHMLAKKTNEEAEDDGWYTHSQMYGSKKSEKHPKGISAIEWKSGIRWHHGKNKRINVKEEIEQVDEDKNLHWMDNEDKGSEAKKRTPVEHKARYKKLVKDAEQFEKHSAIHSYAKNRAQAYKNYHNVNEEVEELDELSKGTMGRYINKAARKMISQGVTAGLKIAADEKSSKDFKDIGKREKGIKLAVNKLTKEDIIDRTIEKYVPEEVKFTPIERFIKRLDGLSESHVIILVGLFEQLNNDNQLKMIETVETREGINQVLNFALENRGE